MMLKLINLFISTSLVAASFHPSFTSILPESYPGELDSYRPLIRLFSTFLLSLSLNSSLLSILITSIQTFISFILSFNSPPTHILPQQLLFIYQIPLLKIFIEITPFTLLSLYILFTKSSSNHKLVTNSESSEEEYNFNTAQEEAYNKLLQLKESVIHNLEILKGLKDYSIADVKDKVAQLEEFIRTFETHNLNFNFSDEVEKVYSRAKQFYDTHKDEIEHSLVPEALEHFDDNNNDEVPLQSTHNGQNNVKPDTGMNDEVEDPDASDTEEEWQVEDEKEVAPKELQHFGSIPKVLRKEKDSDVILSAREEAANQLRERTLKRIQELKARRGTPVKK